MWIITCDRRHVAEDEGTKYQTEKLYYVTKPRRWPYHVFNPFKTKDIKSRKSHNLIKVVVGDNDNIVKIPKYSSDLHKTQKLSKYSKSVYQLVRPDEEVMIRNVGYRPISSRSKAKLVHRK